MTADEVLDALGNPTRRHILALLRDAPRPVGELAAALPISRPAVSRHLRVLADAGLVTHESVGTSHVFSLRRAGFEAARGWLEAFWADALDRFATLAESTWDGAPR